MEVTGTNKSIYFDAETHRMAEDLMKARSTPQKIVTLSQLVRDLVHEAHVELKPVKATVKK